MTKVDIELVKMVLQRNNLDIRTISQIIEDIQVELQEKAAQERPPPVKKQFVLDMIILDRSICFWASCVKGMA